MLSEHAEEILEALAIQIEEQGNPQQVFNQTKSERLQQFLSGALK